MAGKSYDEEDRKYARDLFCAADYQSMDKLVARMALEVPERYRTLRVPTVYRWKYKDKKFGIDWKRLRLQKQRKRVEREGSLAASTAEEVLDRLLNDMLDIQRRLSEMLKLELNPLADDKKQGDPEQLSKKDIAAGIRSLLSPYLKAVDQALSILRGKIKEVDLGRLTHESQVFFLRRVCEDIGQITGEIDEDFGILWQKNAQSMLARMRGMYKDAVITDVQEDLCLENIFHRYEELNARNNCKVDSDQAGVDGVVGRAATANR